MNIYFLVEGKRTEKKIYPKWLSYLVPELKRVQWYHQVVDNNYCIFTGDGFPSLLDNHLRNSIEDVNVVNTFDYFVICLDSDDEEVEIRRQRVIEFMREEHITLNPNTKLVIIVQKKCFETWFLGNKKIFKKNPGSSYLKECISFYNVKENDPELMGKPREFEQTTAIYHSIYLQELLAERNIQYSKKNPHEVGEEYFLKELLKRSKQTNHIQSFNYFIEFCLKIQKEINTF